MTVRLTAIIAATVCLAAGVQADTAAAGSLTPSTPVDWAQAARASGYKQATAWEPHFDNEQLWPLTGKERFLEEKWPEGRLLIWAHPGESGGDRDRRAKHEVFQLKNWIDAATGKPADKLPDAETDVLLPASETPYRVHYRKHGQEHYPFKIRHLTVEAGATWRTSGLTVLGNTWIKRGGRISNHGSLTMVGGKDTFIRNDNGDPSATGRTEGNGVSQYISFNKPGASCEFLGAFATSDEFKVYAGTLIIGRDSLIQPGRNATPFLKKEATLALLDGAGFRKWCNQLHQTDLDAEGTLQGGLPERPLTRDAHVGVSYQNVNEVKFHINGKYVWPEKKQIGDRVVPLMMQSGSRIKTYSEDVSRACLVLGWCGVEAQDYYSSKLIFRRLEPEMQAFMLRQLDRLPKYVTAAFAPEVEVDGVRFNRFLKGGILLADPAVRKSWKNVFYGEDNQAPPEQLFRHTKIDFRSGEYER